jgi:hypothetical protein
MKMIYLNKYSNDFFVVLYSLIIAMAFLVNPFFFFYYEEKEEEGGTTSRV